LVLTMSLPDSKPAGRKPVRHVTFPVDIVHGVVDALVLLVGDDERQRTLWACALVGRSWYHASIQRLYRDPLLSSHNFLHFMATIWLTMDWSHLRGLISFHSLVRRLDLTEVPVTSIKAARLIRKLQGSLTHLATPWLTLE
jgi:hypothetical protein